NIRTRAACDNFVCNHRNHGFGLNGAVRVVREGVVRKQVVVTRVAVKLVATGSANEDIRVGAPVKDVVPVSTDEQRLNVRAGFGSVVVVDVVVAASGEDVQRFQIL